MVRDVGPALTSHDAASRTDGVAKRGTESTVDDGAISEIPREWLLGSTRRLAEKGLLGTARRRICESRAVEVLASVDAGCLKVDDDCLRYVMLLWIGTKNFYRKRVNPKGQDFVRSISLGVVSKHTGEVMLSNFTKDFRLLPDC